MTRENNPERESKLYNIHSFFLKKGYITQYPILAFYSAYMTRIYFLPGGRETPFRFHLTRVQGFKIPCVEVIAKCENKVCHELKIESLPVFFSKIKKIILDFYPPPKFRGKEPNI